MLSSQLDTEFCRTLLHEQLKKLNLPDPSYSWKNSGEGPESTYEGTVEIAGTNYVGGPVMLSSQLDTEFCRTLLHEQLKKLNLPDPSYSWKKSGEGPESTYEGTVEIVGTDYVGGPAKSKKRAAIKAARTALLAIQGQHCKSNTEVVDAHSSTKREREVEQHAGGQNNEANKKRNIENASATDLKDEQSHLQHEMCVDDGQETNAAEVLNYQDTSRKREDEEMVHRTKERAKESREKVVPSLEEIGGQLTKPVA